MASFFATGWGAIAIAAGASPSSFLGIWQTHAESRPANPFLYLSRHTEFIIRRCFFPYALLFFALFNIINVALCSAPSEQTWSGPSRCISSRTFAGAPRAAATSSARHWFRSKGSIGRNSQPSADQERNVPEAVTSMQEIETGDFATWRWVLCPPSSIRVLNWNINRGLQLPRILDFLADAKPDVILLQESDLNARRTHHLNIA